MAGAGIAVAMALPMGHLLLRAVEGRRALDQRLLERLPRLVSDTLLLAATVTLLAAALGVGLAWLLERSDLPARRLLGVAAVLPLVVPTYVGALALVAAVGPRGLAWDMPGIVGFWGLTAVLTFGTYPYVLLTTRAVLRSTDPALEEAGRALGDSAWSAFGRVLLPQLRPAVTAGGLLVFLYVLSDFGAVAIMRFDTLTRAIFVEYRSSFDRARPALLGVVLVVLTLLAATGEHRLRGRARAAPVTAGRSPAPVARLGRWRWPATAAVAAVALAGAGVPVAVLGYWSTARSAVEGSPLAAPALTSLRLSVAAAAVAVAASVPVAVLAVRHRSRFSRVVETVAVSGFALPGLVIALALVFFSARYLPWLYQTATLVVVAYVVRFLPEALGSVRSSLQQVDPALEEAARSLGERPLMVAGRVTLPLLRSGMLAGGALVFLTAMKELPATLLLQPAGTDTLAVRVWTDASQGLYAHAAPPALLLVAVSAALLWPLQRDTTLRRDPSSLTQAPAG